MATVYSLVCNGGDSGSYWNNLSASQKLRYGPSGSERVYGGLVAWNTARASATNSQTFEVCEIGDAFTESTSSQLIISMGSAGCFVTPTVNGTFTSAFHYGVKGAGYVFERISSSSGGTVGTISLTTFNALIFGINIKVIYSASYATGGISASTMTAVSGCFIYKTGGVSGNGIRAGGIGKNSICNIIEGFSAGIYLPRYITGSGLYFNLTTNNDNGYQYEYDSNYINHDLGCNISVGNTTSNWPSFIPTGLHSASYNAGESGDIIPYIGTDTTITMSTSDFYNFAGGDYRPAASSSPQVGAGFAPYGFDAIDIGGDVRPNYNPSGEEEWDIGPFEYDHGNGLAPASATITISAPVSLSGAEIRIYDDDNTPVGSFGTELAGTESHTAATYQYTGQSGNSILIQIMLDDYEEFTQTLTIPTVDTDFYARLSTDSNV